MVRIGNYTGYIMQTDTTAGDWSKVPSNLKIDTMDAKKAAAIVFGMIAYGLLLAYGLESLLRS